MLLAVVVALSSCSSLRTASDYDKNVDFRAYKSYSFYDKGLARLRLNDLDKRRLMAALDAEMAAKGFVKAEGKPDFLVNLVLVSRERTEVYNYGPGYYGMGWGWGWRGGFWGGGFNNVNQFTEGTIIIDFLDPQQKKLFWHGLGSGLNMDNYKKREERFQTGVKEILAQYPPK